MTHYHLDAGIKEEKHLADLSRYHQVMSQVIANNDLADGFFYGNPQYSFPYLPSPQALKFEHRHFRGELGKLHCCLVNEYDLLDDSAFDQLPAGNQQLLAKKVMTQHRKVEELLKEIKLISKK